MTSIRQNDANAIKGIRKILKQGLSEPIQPEPELMIAYDYSPEFAKWTFRWLCVVFLACCFMGCGKHAFASEIPQDKAIKVLVGEASNQGYKGMICVAEVLRHRGSIKGFYGYSASHSSKEPRWVWLQAKRAWLASFHTNYTHYADHFENVHAFGCPYWVSRCIETFRWKDHVFYKEIV